MVALTIAPGAAALTTAGFAWRVALSTITVLGLLLLIVRLIQSAYAQQLTVQAQQLELARARFEEEGRVLGDRLAAAAAVHDEVQENFRQYKIATEREREELGYIADRISEYQAVQYEEELEIVVLVDHDKVMEHHITKPAVLNGFESRLPYRTCRPILPSDPTVTYADLGLEGRIDQDNGVSFDVRLLTQNRQAIRVIALFSPAIEEEIKWTLEYISPGLWKPLRETGRDDLAWDASSPGPSRDTSPFTILRVVFVFPAGARNATVSEVSRRGRTERDDNYPLGPAIVWQIEHPPPVRFRWEVSCPDLRLRRERSGRG
jgi:hypothetical protein